MSNRLAGKIALVTGAGSGIGRGIARCMAAEGATVIINDVNLAGAGAVAREIKAEKGKAIAIKADVTSSAQVKRMVDRVLKRFGRIDILVNNAGIVGKDVGPPITNSSDRDWDAIFAVNVRGIFICCKAVVDSMKARRYGRIINIASVAGKKPAVFIPIYSTSKAAVISFTQVLSDELAPQGITVNAICPGIIWTEIWRQLATKLTERLPRFSGMDAKAAFDTMVTEPASKTEQVPEDIGMLAVFLASDEAKRITGEAISVAGPTPTG